MPLNQFAAIGKVLNFIVFRLKKRHRHKVGALTAKNATGMNHYGLLLSLNETILLKLKENP